MALRDRLPFGLPFGQDPGRKDNGQPAPVDSMLGHTAPAPAPEQLPMPSVGARPIGQSGRANFWGLPAPDELNQQLIGPQGLRRLNEMYRTDAHVRRLVLAAWAPIVAGTWSLEPYGGDDTTDQDRQIAEDIWWLLTEWMSPTFTEHLYQVGPLLLRSGFLACEQVGWQTVKRSGRTLLCPRKLDVRLPTSVWRWWQDDFGELTHIGQILPNRADVIIPATELVYYRLGAEGDNWQGTSLLRHAWKHWYLKDKLERIDAVGQERKAVGVPVVYPPSGAHPQVKAQVERVLATLHTSEVAYVMMPGPKAGSQNGPNAVPQEEWLLDVIKFDSSSGESIHTSIDYHQTAIAASFLTDFLELGHHQVGARATAEVQEDPFLTAVNGALLPPVIPPLNRFIDRIRRLNWDSAEGSPRLKLTLHDEASLSEIAAYVTPLVQSEAMQVDPELEDYLRERAGLPPANADIRLAKQKAQEEGMKAAAELAARGETPGEEPPSPSADPAKPDEPTRRVSGAEPPTGRDAVPAKKLSREEKRAERLRELAADNDRRLAEIDREMEELRLLDSAPVAAGLIVHAADTGRVLVIRRSPDDSDVPDVFARLEFPGGKLGDDAAADDSTPWQTALREFAEETGAELPAGARRLGSFRSPHGTYEAFVAQVPHETDIELGRSDRTEVAAVQWAAPGSLRGGAMSDRAQQLLEGLDQVLAKTLDAAAPLSGGTVGEDGLQMVPELAGTAAACTCPDDDDDVDEDCPVHGKNAPARKTLDAEPTARWFDRLLSQHRLRAAFDGARDHIETAVSPQALLLARQLAHQAANGAPMTASEPPADLAAALERHYAHMYQLGRETVSLELAKQRAVLHRTLDAPGDVPPALAGTRLARARQRGEHSARNILQAVQERLGRDQITGLKDPATLQTAAEKAATAQLRVEALSNTAAMVNDGRFDSAMSAGDVVGGVYTSVMDERACGPCVTADTGDVLAPDDAISLGPPNPDCEGGDFCRCAIVWVLSTDPAAMVMLERAGDPVARLLDQAEEHHRELLDALATSAPAPTIELKPQIDVHVDAPPAPVVHVRPEIKVETPPAPKPARRRKVIRDEEDRIVGLEDE